MKQNRYTLNRCVLLIAPILLLGNVISAQSYDIYVFDVKAHTTKRVTNIANAGEYNATWSPDGKKIAHDVVGGPAAPYGQSIFITDIKSGISRPLIGAEGGNDAAWSPGEEEEDDNEKEDDNIAKGTIAFDNFQSIYTIPAKGGTRSLLTSNSHHASWNPTGNKIAFDDNNGYVATKDLRTGNETFVTGYGDRPAWSPNGQYIAFDGWWWIGGGVWIIKVDTLGNPQGWPIQLTTSGYGPTWKNNSREIVFIDWPNGDPDLYSVPVTGGAATKVCGRVGGFDKGDYDPAYSVNGKFIAWSSFTDGSVAPLTKTFRENRVSELTDKNSFTLLQNYPNPFRDETKISFQVAEPTHVVLTIYTIAGQKIQTLANADYSAGSYIVSWNGKDKNGFIVPNGVYIYQLQTKNASRAKSMSLQR
jgi:Tol biopolymer transport system component